MKDTNKNLKNYLIKSVSVPKGKLTYGVLKYETA